MSAATLLYVSCTQSTRARGFACPKDEGGERAESRTDSPIAGNEGERARLSLVPASYSMCPHCVSRKATLSKHESHEDDLTSTPGSIFSIRMIPRFNFCLSIHVSATIEEGVGGATPRTHCTPTCGQLTLSSKNTVTASRSQTALCVAVSHRNP